MQYTSASLNDLQITFIQSCNNGHRMAQAKTEVSLHDTVEACCRLRQQKKYPGKVLDPIVPERCESESASLSTSGRSQNCVEVFAEL